MLVKSASNSSKSQEESTHRISSEVRGLDWERMGKVSYIVIAYWLLNLRLAIALNL
jgi:hypothetical protein